MSEDYIKNVFDAIDGRVSYSNLGKKKRGRKPGYSHSLETKKKIANKMRNRIKTEETRSKISSSLTGRAKPEEVRSKISKSKTKHTVAEDLLNQYSGISKEKDVPTSTVEWLEKCGYKRADVCTWIRDNYDTFNETADDVRTESHLKARSIKEETSLDHESFYKDEWR